MSFEFTLMSHVRVLYLCSSDCMSVPFRSSCRCHICLFLASLNPQQTVNLQYCVPLESFESNDTFHEMCCERLSLQPPHFVFQFSDINTSQMVLLIYLRNNIYRTILYKYLTSLYFLSSIRFMNIKFYRARFTKEIES